jgi:anti-sigma-K factor RskA
MHLEERLIGDYVDGTLEAGRRSDVERHLEDCESCRRLVEDLREIRRTAAALDPRDPPVRAWTRIERAIRLQAEHRGAAGDGRGEVTAAGRSSAAAAGQRSAWIWRSGLAAAAVLVLAAVVGVRYWWHGATRPPAPSSAARGALSASPDAAGAQGSASEDAAFVEAELREAEAHYDNAIKGLEQIAAAEKGALDPATAAALQKNLAVIDQAISESRAAVLAQPTSEPARDSLMESFKSKLALLQDTVALINELRKGDDAGAARAVSGLKPKGD